MKERRLTSLEGLRLQPGMHTLFLQDNCLLTLEHLGAQPDLQILRLERNLIDDWLGSLRKNVRVGCAMICRSLRTFSHSHPAGADRCPKLKEVCCSVCLHCACMHVLKNKPTQIRARLQVYMDGNPVENKELFHIMACLRSL